MKKKLSDFISTNPEEVPGSLKFPRRWLLTIGEKNSFSEIFSRSFSTGEVVTVSAGLFIILLFAAGLIIVVSPLRSVLPGYLGATERQKLEMLQLRVDSLQTANADRVAYLRNLNAILTGSLPEIRREPTDTSAGAASRIPVDSLIPASPEERGYVAAFEEREKHNKSVLTPIAAEGIQFQKPVKSIMSIMPGDGKGIYIKTPVSSGVDSPFRGTVVATYYNGTGGGTVIIQHPNEFLSSYSGLDRIFVGIGDKVRSGTRLGSLDSRDPVLGIRIWHNGNEVRPAEIIEL